MVKADDDRGDEVEWFATNRPNKMQDFRSRKRAITDMYTNHWSFY